MFEKKEHLNETVLEIDHFQIVRNLNNTSIGNKSIPQTNTNRLIEIEAWQLNTYS